MSYLPVSFNTGGNSSLASSDLDLDWAKSLHIDLQRAVAGLLYYLTDLNLASALNAPDVCDLLGTIEVGLYLI